MIIRNFCISFHLFHFKKLLDSESEKAGAFLPGLVFGDTILFILVLLIDFAWSSEKLELSDGLFKAMAREECSPLPW